MSFYFWRFAIFTYGKEFVMKRKKNTLYKTLTISLKILTSQSAETTKEFAHLKKSVWKQFRKFHCQIRCVLYNRP